MSRLKEAADFLAEVVIRRQIPEASGVLTGSAAFDAQATWENVRGLIAASCTEILRYSDLVGNDERL